MMERLKNWDPNPLPLLVGMLLLTFSICFFAACESTDAHRAGRSATGAALLAFDSPSDEAVFREAKAKIDAYLATGAAINDAVIDLFVDWLAAELGRNPGAVRIVVADLRQWVLQGVEIPPGQVEPARAFVQGVSDALAIAYPD